DGVDARVAPLELDERLARAVAAAVVDQHQLEGAPGRLERLDELLVQLRQVVLLVVERHDDGEVDARGVVHARASIRDGLERPRERAQRPAATRKAQFATTAATTAIRSARPARGDSSRPSARFCGSSARSAAAQSTVAKAASVVNGFIASAPGTSSANSRPSARVEPQVGQGRRVISFT